MNLKKLKLFLIQFWFLSGIILAQGSILLVGGGSENYGDWSDKPYKWFVEQALNRKILVLHYETTTTFFTGYFPSLSSCTVSNLAINSTATANDSSTYKFILEHDGVFLRGGDQAQYVNKWKGTLTEKAIKEIFQRGGVVGGTSAGEMVLSDVSYTSGSTDNGGALRSPSASMSLVDDFLPLVPGTLAESHTNERGRIGRLPVLLARYKNSFGRNITGIAIDVNTALAIDKNGIGEVMGGSAVTLLRWNPETSFLIETGKSFAMQNMSFDQLLPGYRFNFKTGEIELTSTVVEFIPKQVKFPKGSIILDGSANPSDWAAATGSLRKLQSILINSSDVIGVFSSTSNSNSANTVGSALNSWGVNSQILLIDDDKKNDPVFAAAISSCGAFIFVDNSLTRLSNMLNHTTAAGNAFSSKLNEGKPILFLSDDVMLAGEKVIDGLYSSVYSAYYGTLTQIDGLNLIKGIQLVPRFYQNQNNSRGYDYSENRIMGMFWSMAKSQLPYGLLIDAGTHVTFSNNIIEAGGVSTTSTSLILFDARNAKWIDYSTFYRPGKPNPVQNITLIGADLHIIRPGETNIITSNKSNKNLLPSSFSLEQNYPNPFNPSTKIRFSISHSAFISMKIFDILGREVMILINEQVESGVYEKTWDASGYASGIYFVKLDQKSPDGFQSRSIKIVLNK